MKIVFIANSDWYLFNFKLSLAKEIRKNGHEVVLISPPGAYVSKFQADGFRWISLSMDRISINPISEIGVTYQIYKILQEEKVDLVHNFTTKCIVYGGLAAKLAGVRYVVHEFSGLGHLFSKPNIKFRIIKYVVSAFLWIARDWPGHWALFQNSRDQELLTSAGLIKKEKTFLILGGVGVDVTKFKPSKKGNLSSIPMVLFASRLLIEKGILEFVGAAKELKNRGVKAEFVVAGEPDPGNPGSATLDDIEKWKSLNCVSFLGHRSDMPELLQRASIVVLVTSYGEGLPTILIEAAASGVPIITSKNPPCLEVVKHGVNGLTIDEHDQNALVKSIRNLLDSPQERSRMGANARRIVIENFEEKSVFKKLIDMYKNIELGLTK